MNISSRTPKGDPYVCPICTASAPLETSDADDSLSPQCGRLLWKFRDSLKAFTGNSIVSLSLDDPISEKLEHSLDVVELVMRFEDTCGVQIPEHEYENVHTLEDAIRLLRRFKAEQSAE